MASRPAAAPASRPATAPASRPATATASRPAKRSRPATNVASRKKQTKEEQRDKKNERKTDENSVGNVHAASRGAIQGASRGAKQDASWVASRCGFARTVAISRAGVASLVARIESRRRTLPPLPPFFGTPATVSVMNAVARLVVPEPGGPVPAVCVVVTGPHGCGKSWLLDLVCERWRHLAYPDGKVIDNEAFERLTDTRCPLPNVASTLVCIDVDALFSGSTHLAAPQAGGTHLAALQSVVENPFRRATVLLCARSLYGETTSRELRFLRANQSHQTRTFGHVFHHVQALTALQLQDGADRATLLRFARAVARALRDEVRAPAAPAAPATPAATAAVRDADLVRAVKQCGGDLCQLRTAVEALCLHGSSGGWCAVAAADREQDAWTEARQLMTCGSSAGGSSAGGSSAGGSSAHGSSPSEASVFMAYDCLLDNVAVDEEDDYGDDDGWIRSAAIVADRYGTADVLERAGWQHAGELYSFAGVALRSSQRVALRFPDAERMKSAQHDARERATEQRQRVTRFFHAWGFAASAIPWPERRQAFARVYQQSFQNLPQSELQRVRRLAGEDADFVASVHKMLARPFTNCAVTSSGAAASSRNIHGRRRPPSHVRPALLSIRLRATGMLLANVQRSDACNTLVDLALEAANKFWAGKRGGKEEMDQQEEEKGGWSRWHARTQTACAPFQIARAESRGETQSVAAARNARPAAYKIDGVQTASNGEHSLARAGVLWTDGAVLSAYAEPASLSAEPASLSALRGYHDHALVALCAAEVFDEASASLRWVVSGDASGRVSVWAVSRSQGIVLLTTIGVAQASNGASNGASNDASNGASATATGLGTDVSNVETDVSNVGRTDVSNVGNADVVTGVAAIQDTWVAVSMTTCVVVWAWDAARQQLGPSAVWRPPQTHKCLGVRACKGAEFVVVLGRYSDGHDARHSDGHDARHSDGHDARHSDGHDAEHSDADRAGLSAGAFCASTGPAMVRGSIAWWYRENAKKNAFCRVSPDSFLLPPPPPPPLAFRGAAFGCARLQIAHTLEQGALEQGALEGKQLEHGAPVVKGDVHWVAHAEGDDVVAADVDAFVVDETRGVTFVSIGGRLVILSEPRDPRDVFQRDLFPCTQCTQCTFHTQVVNFFPAARTMVLSPDGRLLVTGHAACARVWSTNSLLHSASKATEARNPPECLCLSGSDGGSETFVHVSCAALPDQEQLMVWTTGHVSPSSLRGWVVCLGLRGGDAPFLANLQPAVAAQAHRHSTQTCFVAGPQVLVYGPQLCRDPLLH